MTFVCSWKAAAHGHVEGIEQKERKGHEGAQGNSGSPRFGKRFNKWRPREPGVAIASPLPVKKRSKNLSKQSLTKEKNKTGHHPRTTRRKSQGHTRATHTRSRSRVRHKTAQNYAGARKPKNPLSTTPSTSYNG